MFRNYLSNSLWRNNAVVWETRFAWIWNLSICRFRKNSRAGIFIATWWFATCSIWPQVAEKQWESDICAENATYKLLINYTSLDFESPSTGTKKVSHDSRKIIWEIIIYPGIASGRSQWKILSPAERKATNRPWNVVVEKTQAPWIAKIRCSKPENISNGLAFGSDRDSGSIWNSLMLLTV